jgi:hypothetical protein
MRIVAGRWRSPGACSASDEDVVLAVVLRQLQWALDSVARDVGSLTADRAAELAVLLEDTASLVRHARGRNERLGLRGEHDSDT